MLHAFALAISLLSPVLAVTPVVPPSEAGGVPDACRGDYERLTKQTQIVVAYRNAVALLTKGSAPSMPGALQQQSTDAYNDAHGSIAKPAAGPTERAQAALVQLYTAAEPLDETVVQYASDLQGYVDTVAESTGTEPKSIAAPAANASRTELDAWSLVRQDVAKLDDAVAKIDAALTAERDAQSTYLRACRGEAAPTPASTASEAPAPTPTPAPTSAAPAGVIPNATSQPLESSPAADQLRSAFGEIIGWLKAYKSRHGEYPDHVDRTVLVNANALNPFHTEFGYRKVGSTFYLGTFTGLCACDNEMAKAFAQHDDWYEKAGKHAPFHAPGIWYAPSVYFR
ncbi:MAG: hypothetical protein KGM44_02135 [bacterium]|nr:hypothetical protein [bacterium]